MKRLAERVATSIVALFIVLCGWSAVNASQQRNYSWVVTPSHYPSSRDVPCPRLAAQLDEILDSIMPPPRTSASVYYVKDEPFSLLTQLHIALSQLLHNDEHHR